jgi:type IX secretion system PorP/SprF family membrane protein
LYLRSYRYIFRRFIICYLALFCFTNKALSQDFHFTQFFANKLFLAPSFAGATAQNRFIANYRNQWPGVNGFVTYSTSFDHYFSNFNSGLGTLIMRDVAGTGKLGALHLGLYYSYDLNVNESLHIRPGVAFIYLQRSVDYSRFTFGDELINPDSPGGGTVEVFPQKDHVGSIDASSSVIIYTPKLTLGVTLDHMFQPNLSLLESEDRMPMRFSVYGVVTVMRKGRLLKPIDETISIAAIFKNQKDFRQLDIGVYWAKSPLTFGLWYRGIPIVNSDRGDSFAALIGLKRQKFSLGYSYDFTVSNLINKTSGAHELSMTIEFSKSRRRKLHMVPCPEF